MQLEAHPDSRRHHLLQQVHVGEHPLVLGGDAEVPLKQRVESIQEGLQAGGGGTGTLWVLYLYTEKRTFYTVLNIDIYCIYIERTRHTVFI